MQDTAIGALAEAMLAHRKTGFLVARAADRRTLHRALQKISGGPEAEFAVLTGSTTNAEAEALGLVRRQCDLIVLWQVATSLQERSQPGELVMPTRVVDAESEERFDTGLTRMGRRDRAAILSAGIITDPGQCRRLAMRFQCVVMDSLSSTLARCLARAEVPLFIVCAQIDRRADHWTNRILTWQMRYGSQALLSRLAWAMFKPRELMVSHSSRGEARMALHDAVELLRESLEDAIEDMAAARSVADV